MISKIVPSCQLILKQFYRPLVSFQFSQDQFSSEPNISRQILALEQCNTFRKALHYANKKGNQAHQTKPEQLKKIFEKLSKYSGMARPGQSLWNFIKNARIDFNAIDSETFGYICRMSFIVSFPGQFQKQIIQKISTLISDPSQLSDETIINFLQFALIASHNKLADNISEILLTRVPLLKFNYYHRILNLFRVSKLPTKNIRQLMEAISKRLIDNLDTLNNNLIITAYRALSPLNPRVWNTFEIMSKVEKKLTSKIEDIDEKQFQSLIKFQSQINSFHHILIDKVLQEINDEGQTELDPKLILRLLSKIKQSHQNLYFSKWQKLMKFLLRNLDSPKEIKEIINNDFMPYKYQYRICKGIQSSPQSIKQMYETDYVFMTNLLIKNINCLSCDKVIEIVKNKMSQEKINLTNFIYIAIILQYHAKLSNSSALDYPEIRTKIQEIKSNFKYFGNLASLNCPMKVIQNFHFHFKQYYMSADILSKQLSYNQIVFLLLMNSHKQNLQLLAKNPKFNIPSFIKNLMLQPHGFKGKFNKINFIFKHFLKSYPSINTKTRSALAQYLFDTEIQMLLSEQETYLFFQLVGVLQKQRKISDNLISNYLIHSKSFVIRQSKYIKPFLLKMIQEIMSRQNLSSMQRTSFKNFVKDLLSYGLLNQDFVSYLKKNEAVIDDYILTLFAEPLDQNKPLQDNYYELLKLVKNNNIEEEYLKSNQSTIEKIIQKLNVKQIPTVIINFHLKKSQQTFKLLDFLFSCLKKEEPKNIRRINLVLQKAQKYNLQSQNYVEFLELYCSKFSKHLKSLNNSTHLLLMRELYQKKVPCQKYTKNMCFYLQKNDQKIDFDQSSVEILQNLIYLEPRKSFYLVESQLKRSKRMSLWLKKLILFDLKDQEILKKIQNLFQKSDNLLLSPLNFSLLKYKIPALNNYESKWKSIQETKCWFNDQLVKFLKQQKMNYEIISKQGVNILQINSKYIAIIPQQFQQKIFETLQNFYQYHFGIEHLENIVVLFTKKQSSKRLAYKLCKLINEFEEKRQQLEKHMINSQRNYQMEKKSDKQKQVVETHEGKEAEVEIENENENEQNKLKNQTEKLSKEKKEKKQKSSKEDQWQS